MLFAFTVGRTGTSRSEKGASRWSCFRKVLGLESAKDADGNIIQQAPLPVWALVKTVDCATFWAIRPMKEVIAKIEQASSPALLFSNDLPVLISPPKH
jgi:hypothetical protein